jgi:hypothetical protein
MRRAPSGIALILLALAAARMGIAREGATPAVPAELTRVDLARRSVTVKTEGRPARELEAAVTAATRVVSRGRALRLEDLRPGDRVVLVATEEGSARLARVIKVVGRTALGLPSPSLTATSPAAPPPAATGGSPG